MSIFSFDVKDALSVMSSFEDKDTDYSIFCLEFNKIVNKYIINQELHSKKFWDYLVNTFKITSEDNVLQKTEISVDEKNRKRKHYKYYVKCQLDKKRKIYMMFFDEFRNLSDEDYHDFVTDEDKTDKITKLIIYYDNEEITTKELEEDIVSKILECSYITTNKNQFFTISSSCGEYELRPSYIKSFDIDLELNYGKKFLEVNAKIIDKLYNEKHGLFLFHGDPGVGKTYYIRKLISELSEKKTIIYVPSYLMQYMADPNLISFISGFRDVILLLEDSEHVLANSMNERTQAVSNILNMTDGLLNDYMDVQIIATFNTDARVIDPALKRSGRLIVNYKFGKLSKAQANKLSKKLGLNKTYNEPVSLADIYEGANQIVQDDDLNENPIGFKLNND